MFNHYLYLKRIQNQFVYQHDQYWFIICIRVCCITITFDNEYTLNWYKYGRYKRCTESMCVCLTGDVSPPEYTETSSGQNQNKSWHSKRRAFHVCVHISCEILASCHKWGLPASPTNQAQTSTKEFTIHPYKTIYGYRYLVP